MESIGAQSMEAAGAAVALSACFELSAPPSGRGAQPETSTTTTRVIANRKVLTPLMSKEGYRVNRFDDTELLVHDIAERFPHSEAS
jgi:hypothetical protein